MSKTDKQEPEAGKSLQAMVAANIRTARKRRNITLDGIARAMDTTPQTAQRLETNNMTLSVSWIERFAAALNISPAALMPEGFHSLEDALKRQETLRRLRFALKNVDDVIDQTLAVVDTMMELNEKHLVEGTHE